MKPTDKIKTKITTRKGEEKSLQLSYHWLNDIRISDSYVNGKLYSYKNEEDYDLGSAHKYKLPFSLSEKDSSAIINGEFEGDIRLAILSFIDIKELYKSNNLV